MSRLPIYHDIDNTEGDMILEEGTIEGVAKYIQSRDCKKIFVMTGAGISTSAGIPDFRSPETGLYANLARLKLPYPEAVFDIGFFRKNPLPFYTLAHELAPGRYRPTKTHSFIRLLHEKKYLDLCFTQNIDTLERRAGIPEEQIVEAHGSFATQRCINCKTEFNDKEMKQHIKEKKVPKCKLCKGLVKPDIVFFGEALPNKFHKSIFKLVGADLLIIIGTSLTVHPFASLTDIVPKSCPRVLINLDAVGDLGSRSNDVLLLGKCDDVVQKLCRLLKWDTDLEKLWAETESTLDTTEKTGEKSVQLDVDKEVQKLTREVAETLKVADEEKSDAEKLGRKDEEKSPPTLGATEEPSETSETVTDATPKPKEEAKGGPAEDTPKRVEESTVDEHESKAGKL